MKLVQCLARIACLVAFSLSTGAATSEDDIPLTVFVTTVAQADSPVQIIGLNMPDKINGHPAVLFRNVSGKEVRRLDIRAQVGNPSDPETTRGILHGSNFYAVLPRISPHIDTEALVLHAGKSGENGEQLPSSSFLVTMAMHLHSNCLHVAVVVEAVEFSDGTQWEIDHDQEAALWRHSLTADSAKHCDNSPRVQEAMRQLRSSRFKGVREPLHPGQSAQENYSYFCSMHKKENYEFANCPF